MDRARGRGEMIMAALQRRVHRVYRVLVLVLCFLQHDGQRVECVARFDRVAQIRLPDVPRDFQRLQQSVTALQDNRESKPVLPSLRFARLVLGQLETDDHGGEDEVVILERGEEPPMLGQSTTAL